MAKEQQELVGHDPAIGCGAQQNPRCQLLQDMLSLIRPGHWLWDMA